MHSRARAAAVVAAAVGLTACTPFFATTPEPSPVARISPVPSPSPTPVPSPTTPPPSPSPSPIPTETPYLYLLIQQTEYGFISANTDTGAICNATVVLPNGQHAPGVKNPKVADWTGHVSWWYPAPTTDDGSGEHYVTCTLNGLTSTGFAPFDVKES